MQRQPTRQSDAIASHGSLAVWLTALPHSECEVEPPTRLMPGKWVGGKGSKACPSRGDFVEGQVLDDQGDQQGTIFLEVKRIYAPGSGGRFFLGDVLSASDRFYRHWLTTEEGRVTTRDGSYHLCSAHECDVRGSGGTVVHVGKWRNWPAHDLTNGLPIEYDKECRGQVMRYMKEGPGHGGGAPVKKSPLIPYDKPKPILKKRDPKEKGEPKKRPSSSSQKKPEGDSSSTSFGSEEEDEPPAKVTELRKELESLKVSLKKAEDEAAKKKGKHGKPDTKSEKKKDSSKKKKKKKSPRVSFETGIAVPPEEEEPDYSAGDGSADRDEEDPSDDSETKGDDKPRKSKKRKKGKSGAEKKKDKAKKKKKRKEAESDDSEEEKRRKKKRRKKDKGPYGLGTTDAMSESSEPDGSDDSSEDFQKAPSGMSHQLKLVKYAQKFPGKLAARLLRKMSLATRFSGGAVQLARKQMGQVTPAAHVYFLTVMTPQLRDRWTPRTQRELKCWVSVLDLLAENRGPQAADLACQRIKALEKSVVDGQWRRAKFLELVEQEDLPLTDRGEENMMRKEQELEEKLRGKGSWYPWTEWSQKGGKDHDDRVKGKGKKGKGGKGKNPTEAGTGQAEKKVKE